MTVKSIVFHSQLRGVAFPASFARSRHASFVPPRGPLLRRDRVPDRFMQAAPDATDVVVRLLDLGLCSPQHSAGRGSGDVLAGRPARLREPHHAPLRLGLGRRLPCVGIPPWPSRSLDHRPHSTLDRLLEVSFACVRILLPEVSQPLPEASQCFPRLVATRVLSVLLLHFISFSKEYICLRQATVTITLKITLKRHPREINGG